MITVKIDEDTALDMLMDELKAWTKDPTAIKLYEQMYKSHLYSGYFDDCEFYPSVIVDNDCVNWCRIIKEDVKDPEWKEVYKIYKKQGIGDCICKRSFASYIEAVDDEECPHAFLVRLS